MASFEAFGFLLLAFSVDTVNDVLSLLQNKHLRLEEIAWYTQRTTSRTTEIIATAMSRKLEWNNQDFKSMKIRAFYSMLPKHTT